MNYNFEEYTFPSSDGKHTIYAEIYTPKSGEIRGVVQLSHGMVDHPGRYMNLVRFLTGEGYVFAGHHHLGHGKSAQSKDELGFFADEGGVGFILADLHTMNKYLRNRYPDFPLVLFGHSMGSFIARLYINLHPHSIRAAVIHGTGGPNKLAPVGIGVAKLISLLTGKRGRSRLILALAFGTYNKKCSMKEGMNAWLSRDNSQIAGKKSDPLASFRFTNSGYIDLFNMLCDCNSREWFENYPKDMRTLLVSGDADPVGGWGKGVKYVYKELMCLGASELEMKLYPGARHELFNETNREEFFRDLLAWLDGVTV